MRHPSMTTRGTQLTFLIALVIVLLLPKWVACGYPGGSCGREGRWGATCTDYEVEPLGIYLIELIADRNLGPAYSSGEDCR